VSVPEAILRQEMSRVALATSVERTGVLFPRSEVPSEACERGLARVGRKQKEIIPLFGAFLAGAIAATHYDPS